MAYWEVSVNEVKEPSPRRAVACPGGRAAAHNLAHAVVILAGPQPIGLAPDSRAEAVEMYLRLARNPL
jgi:hypothetical protein